MENGNAVAKDTGGTGPIRHTMSKTFNSSSSLPVIDKTQKDPGGT